MQAIADHVGVTQPLVHRYFPTKSKLLDAVRTELLQGHWRVEWRELLADRRRPLRLRLEAFYRDYLGLIFRRAWYRGFLHIAMQDSQFAQAYLSKVRGDVLTTVLGETRHALGLPGPGAVRLHDRELGLAWGLHSALVFVGIRKFIYELTLPERLRADHFRPNQRLPADGRTADARAAPAAEPQPAPSLLRLTPVRPGRAGGSGSGGPGRGRARTGPRPVPRCPPGPTAWRPLPRSRAR